MAGSKEGAAKARETILKNDPDFYKNIGGQSWKNPDRSRETGFALLPKEEHLELSKKGGQKTKKDYHRYIVDDEDVSRVSARKWYRRKDGYWEASLDGKKVLLHRFIMQPPDNMVIDHINHDKSDNRKENLSICTQYENSQNRLIGNKGCVHFDKGKWQASVQVLRARFYLGRFDTKEEALSAVKDFKDKKRKETNVAPETQGVGSGDC